MATTPSLMLEIWVGKDTPFKQQQQQQLLLLLVCVYVYAYKCLCRHACGGQRITLGADSLLPPWDLRITLKLLTQQALLPTEPC